ncbi:Hypothetical protein Y17_1441 [Pectobacterium wasabiae CFBP 3304]|nr:Hypothetical protein Y17_1441 [Pectobacterium wasabiae CFBP 3304]
MSLHFIHAAAFTAYAPQSASDMFRLAIQAK